MSIRCGWDAAWAIVDADVCATRITLCCRKRLEKWSVALFERVLPRHLQIIFDINTRLHAEGRGDVARRQ